MVRRAVDWQGVMRRLDAATRALAQEHDLPAEMAANLLQARARSLAHPVQQSPDLTASGAAMVFSVGNERFAIAAEQVRGVFRLRDLAPLPGARAGIAGLTFWRGELLVVMDLRPILGLQVSGLDDLSWIVAIGDDRRSRGLLAGSLHDVSMLSPADLAGEPRQLGGQAAAPLLGLTRQATQVLDATALLGHEA